MGKLYVVPTPVGNLEDMTFRAIRILKEADLVLAEDTRTSGILLKHFEIKNAMQSHHKFNEHKTVESVVNRIKGGETVALISDAGTPGISDPGFLVVRECVRNGIEVQCLPGATAFVPALVASGLPNEKFCFEGFLPQKKGRMTRLKGLAEERQDDIFCESASKTFIQSRNSHVANPDPASFSPPSHRTCLHKPASYYFEHPTIPILCRSNQTLPQHSFRQECGHV